VQIRNTICGCGFRFDESKLTEIKYGLKMVRNVLMRDSLKYLEKVLRFRVWCVIIQQGSSAVFENGDNCGLLPVGRKNSL